MFAATACALFFIQSHDHYWTFERVDPEQYRIRELNEDLTRLRPPLHREAKVLFLKDGFAPDTWTPLYVVRMFYHDPNIAVDRLKKGTPPLPSSDYSLILDYCGQHYYAHQCSD